MNAESSFDMVIWVVIGTLIFLALSSRIPLLLLAVAFICLPCAWLYLKSRARK